MTAGSLTFVQSTVVLTKSPDGTRYMVKYSEKYAPCNDLVTNYVNNVVSEYVSSHSLVILGYPVHDTELGTLDGEVMVACCNFIPAGWELLEFEKFMRRHYDSHDIGRVLGIRQIYEILKLIRCFPHKQDVSSHSISETVLVSE